MRRTHPAGSHEAYYDIEDDWELIEASFAKQYGIRLRQDDDMSWPEFASLLAGIMPDTPLGVIVSIRSEKDPKKISAMTKEQKKIRNDWQRRRFKKNPEAYADFWRQFQISAMRAYKS